MTYKDLNESCDGCPIGEDGICPGGMACYGGQPVEPPCTCFEPETDLEEWLGEYYINQQRYDDLEDKNIRYNTEKVRLNEIKQSRRRESKRHVFSETTQIKRLKKRIQGIDGILRVARAFADATNITNEAFGYEERATVKDTPLEKEKEEIKEKIIKLEQIKKQKLKELRGSRA